MASTAQYAVPSSPGPRDAHFGHRHSQPSHGHTHSHSHSHTHSHQPKQPSSPNKLAPMSARTPYAPRVMQNGGLHSSHARNYSLGGMDTYTVSPIREDHDDPLNIPSFSGFPPNGVRDAREKAVGEKNNGHGHGHGLDHGRKESVLYQEFTGVDYGAAEEHKDHDHGHDHLHEGHTHAHGSSCDGHGHSAKAPEPRSKATQFLLRKTKNSSLLQSILLEKDSRRIFYFMNLNFAFMIIQAFYGFATDSLGLLSDSIHMFFDCIALGLGLFAAVASKWPPTQRFPYGFGKIETLAGFGNGVFLMLISVEICLEAAERLREGHETKRLGELFVVSSLGLAVNLVGMACFGHHHHGHDHGHSHDDHTHSHSHSDEKPHSHSPSHGHQHTTSDHPLLQSPPPAAASSHSHASHTHTHDNENMRGIFLHVLADTMGSAAVIVSTILIHFTAFSGWDPLASVLIAVLIFLSSIPLVSSCARRLLLAVGDDTEYKLRETLSGVSDLRGVSGYSVPRFWMADRVDEDGGEEKEVLGVMHVIASRGADMDDVRERTRKFLGGHGMDVVVQVEREGGAKCWCGGDGGRSPSSTSRF